MVTLATVAEVHSAMSPMAEGSGGPAAPTFRIVRSKSFKKKKKKSMVDMLIDLEKITEAPITELGFGDGGANNVNKRNINVERRPGNGRDQGEITPG